MENVDLVVLAPAGDEVAVRAPKTAVNCEETLGHAGELFDQSPVLNVPQVHALQNI